MCAVRKRAESGIYHVMTRGVNKCDIFLDDGDRRHYLRTLKKLLERRQVEMLAWCLMGNHVHLLPKTPSFDQLAELMRDLNADYSSYFNWRHDRVGHLVQGRYASKPVEDETYLMTVVRYIHQNPIGVYTTSCDYRWSSYQEYTGKCKPVITTIDGVVASFGSLEEFKRFHREAGEPDGALDPDLKTRLDDDAAHELALRILEPHHPMAVKTFSKTERKAKLRSLHEWGLSFRQIAMETGISRSTVADICRHQP